LALSARTKSVADINEIPKTSDDFENMFEWQYGDELYGTQARSSEYIIEYARDIYKAIQMEERDKYIDTFSTVSKQLRKYKKRRV